MRLLGPVQVEWDGAPVHGFESRKELALLCYLAVQDQPVSRTHLANLFWGDKPEARGRGNLSRVLHNLATLLPDCWQVDRHAVRLRQDSSFWLDVTAFTDLATQDNVEARVAAVALYRDDFMADFFLDDCPEFETWLLAEQERWRQHAIQMLSSLIDHCIRLGEYDRGLEFARRLLDLEPWREEAHRQMMFLLAHNGQQSAALAHYETCRRVLAEELGLEPDQETTVLYERIRNAGAIRRYNLPPQPTPFINREVELCPKYCSVW